jgi:hypothetical protein
MSMSMPIELTPREIELLLESAGYSIQRIGDGTAPHALRQSKKSELEAIVKKLRAHSSSSGVKS